MRHSLIDALKFKPIKMLLRLRSLASPVALSGRRALSSAQVMRAQKIALDEVPLVDISPLVQRQRAPEPAQKAQILADMRRACLDAGFFSVPTKGVLSNDLIAKVCHCRRF